MEFVNKNLMRPNDKKCSDDPHANYRADAETGYSTDTLIQQDDIN